MNEKVAVARNAGYAFAGEIVQKIVLLIYGLIIPRYLGPEDYGIYGYALAFVGIIKIFIDLGTGTMSVREIARNNSVSRQMMPQILGMKVFLGIVMFFLVLGITSFSETPKSAAALRLLATTLFLEQGIIYIQVFRALEKMKYYFYAQSFCNVLLIIVLPFILIFNLGLKGVICGQLISNVIGSLFIFFMVQKQVEPVSIGFDFKYWIKILKDSLPFAALSIVWEIYNRVDLVIIPWLDSFQSNGYYKIATVIPAMSTMIPISIFAAVFPYFTRNAGVSQESIRSATVTLYRYLSIFGLGITLMIGACANDWVIFLWGNEFISGSPSLAILCAGVPFAFLTGIHINVLYSLDSQNRVLSIAAVTILLDVILDIVLIPIMGISGAAMATVVANVILFTMTYLAVTKKLGAIPFFRTVSGPFFSCAVAYAAVSLASGGILPVKFLISGIIFLTLLITTKSIVIADFHLFKDIFRKSR